MANLKSTITIDGQNNAAAAINAAIAGIVALKAQIDGLSAAMTSQGTAAQSSAAAIVSAANQSSQSMTQIGAAATTAASAMQQIVAAASGVSAAMQGVGSAASTAASNIGAQFRSASSGATSSISEIKSALKGFIAFSAIKSIAIDFMHMSDEISNANAKIRIATSGVAEFAQAQSQLFAISQKNSMGFAATASIYARMKLATGDLGTTSAEVVGIVDTLQKTFLLSGASAQEAKNGLLEFSHVMSEGKLQGRQLNALLMEDPVLLKAVADGLGTTTGALRQFSHDGVLSIKTIMLALDSQKDKIDEMSKNVPMTFGRAMTQLSNAALMFIGRLNESNGAVAAVTAGMVAMSKHLDEIAFALVAAIGIVAAAFIGTLVPAIAAAIAAFAEYVTAVGLAEAANMTLGAGMRTLAAGMLSSGGIVAVAAAAAAAFVYLGKTALDAATDAYNASVRMGNAAVAVGASVQKIKSAKNEVELRAAGAAANAGIGDAGKEILDLRKKIAEKRAEGAELTPEMAALSRKTGLGGDALQRYDTINGWEQQIKIAQQQQQRARDEYAAKAKELNSPVTDISKVINPTTAEKVGRAQKSQAEDQLSKFDESHLTKKEQFDKALKSLDDESRKEKNKSTDGVVDPKDDSFKTDPAYLDRKARLEEEYRDKAKKAAGPKNTGSADDYNLRKAQIEAESKVQIDGEKRTQEGLKSEYAEGLLSLEAYEAKRLESIDRALQAELRAKKAELDDADHAVAQAQKGGNKKEIDGALARQYTLNADIKRIEGEIAGERDKNNPKDLADRRALNDELEKTKTQIETITGHQTAANIAKQVEITLEKELIAAKHAGTAEAMTDYEQLKAIKTAQAQFQGLVVDKKGTIDADASNKTAAVQRAVADGTLRQIAADRDLTAIHRDQASAYQQLIDVGQKLADEAGGKLPAEVEALKIQVKTLNEVVDTTAVSINAALTSGISGALDGIISHTMTFKQAFLSVVKSLVTELNKTVSAELTSSLMKSMFGDSKTGGVGGFFSNLFGSGSGAGSSGGAAAYGTADMAQSASAFSMAPGFAEGGHVQGPGTSTSDSIAAWLSKDEFVFNARAVGHYGLGILNSMNSVGGGRPSISGQLAYATGGVAQTGGGKGGGDIYNVSIKSDTPEAFKKSKAQLTTDLSNAVNSARRNS